MKTSSTHIKAKTFTCNYIEKEDRILLSINYEDILNRVDFWVTRAFLLKLLPYFFEYSSSECHKEKEPKIQNSNKNTKSTDLSTFALTQQKPILLESVDIKKLPSNIQINFKNLEKNIFVVAFFDSSNFSAFVTLLSGAAPRYDWGITTL